ncbi:MAG: Cys-tRNA(Pro) deacylase [Treponema sp.]|jgi:Cys-tRNA(Pro)/Cys-tRNA(Cys) deacylase|nr:Cys-tRNA(Pro) deacylase [Treponema sp.]
MKSGKQPGKTNAQRLLDAAGIRYETRDYSVDTRDLGAARAARLLGLPPEQVFKTLVLLGSSSAPLVCCVPASGELDQKKAAVLAGEKSVDLLPVKDLEALTGYVRGGCSPIGMKKKFPLFIDETAELFPYIAVSAGTRGVQILIAPSDLARFTGALFADLLSS